MSFSPDGDPAPLRTHAGRRGLALEFVQGYVIALAGGTSEQFVVKTVSYRYHILDAQGREIIAYHWHPEGESPLTFPHFHLTSRVRPIELGEGLEPVALAEMHLPTGPVRLAGIVRLLIAEFGVAPRRNDWASILAESEAPI